MSKQVKPMGKEYTDPEQRKRFLKDNSDAVVEKSYMKNFTPEQLQGFKEDLAECCMETSEIASELKEIKEQFKMPIFKGSTPQTIEVETFAQIDGKSVGFVLLSPGANEVLNELRDKAIDEQVEQILAITPQLVVIEK